MNALVPSFSPTCAKGIEDAGYERCELSLIAFTEKSVDGINGWHFWNSHKAV